MDQFSGIDYLVYIFFAVAVAVLSGISGAGGGFIMTPLLIFLGLTPAQAVSTGKIGGFAVSVGSLGGMKGVKIRSKKIFYGVLILAFVVGLLAPFAITRLDNEFYRTFLGVVLILMIPVVYLKKLGRREKETSFKRKVVGLGFIAGSLGLQGVFSGGLGTLVNLALMNFMGMGALEANVVKRYSQLILNITIVIAVLASGLILWKVAILGVICSGTGGYIGGRIAKIKGNGFIMNTMMILMLVSGVWLIAG